MLNKKYFIILLLLIVGIYAISSVNALDNDIDGISSDDAEALLNPNCELSGNAKEVGEIVNNYNPNTLGEIDCGEKLASPEDSYELTFAQSGEKLSVLYAENYTIDLNEEYLISAHEDAHIKYHRIPCPEDLSAEAYHFYIRITDSTSNIHYEKEVKGTNRKEGDFIHTITKDTVKPGTYTLSFINYDDGKIMDSAILKVRGTAAITVNNYNANYMSNTPMSVRITDKDTGLPLTALSVNVVFTNGKTSISRNYRPNSNGQISFIPSLSAGAWTVKFTPAESHISGSVVKTFTVKKSKVALKANKAVSTKGSKVTLKATVTCNGKKVNEGSVTFKINGKTYKINVKNGVANKKVKLKKVKKTVYTAKFNGSKNLLASGKVKAKAVIKKR